MQAYLAALLIGVVAGLRTVTAPAAVSWAATLGWLALRGTALGFLANPISPWVFTVLGVLELIGDKLPWTPSRKSPAPFAARLVSGGFCGAAIGLATGHWIVGLVLGVAGAVIGTLGGYTVRMGMASSFGADWTAAVIEDAVAVGGALLIVVGLL